MLRTHTSGELRIENVGEQASLCGWVASRRDHKGTIFVDLRDRYGITQISVSEEDQPEAHAAAVGVRPEYTVQIEGGIQAGATVATGGAFMLKSDVLREKMGAG